MMSDAHRLWNMCAALLRAQVSDPVWHTAFEGVRAVDFDGRSLTLGVSSPLAKERIEGRYLGLVRDALTEAGAAHVELLLRIEPPEPPSLWTVPPPPPATTGSPAFGPPTTGVPGQGTIPGGRGVNGDTPLGAPPGDIELNPRYTFENFVIGGSNRFAHAAAQSVAEMPARRWNPLFVYGDAGLGKTHLLQAIASYVNDNYPAYRVRYVTSETFLNEFIDSMQSGSRDAFKRRYRDIDVLLVDDVQFFQGKQETLEEFFHTFNHLHQTNRQIVLSSDRAPDQIGFEDRLRSRFQQGLLTDIQPPELETRLAILRKKAELETARIPAEVLEFIAANIKDNIRVLEGALIRVSAFASLTHEPITVDRADPGPQRPAQREPAPTDHAAAHPRRGVGAVRVRRRGPEEQAPPAAAGDRPPDRHVRHARADRAVATPTSPASSAAATTRRSSTPSRRSARSCQGPPDLRPGDPAHEDRAPR